MAVLFKGGTDMTFHKLDRSEILRELDWVKHSIGENCTSSEVVIINRNGEKLRVVKVKDTPKGVFLYDLPETLQSAIHLAPYMGSDMKILDVDELYQKLSDTEHEDVWLQFYDEKPHTVVGKVLGVRIEDKLLVSLTPVPEDIEEVNRFVHEEVSKECAAARSGVQCGACPNLRGCKTLEAVDKRLCETRG